MSDISVRYGQDIEWGAVNAPQLFTGECMSFTYDKRVQEQMIAGAAGGNIAMALHSMMGDLRFRAKVTSASTDFLDLSTGAAIEVTGIDAGLVLCNEAEQSWRLLQAAEASVAAMHLPDAEQETGEPAAPGTLSAVAPTQTELGILFPGGVLPYSTYGFGHDAGVVHALTIRQSLTIKPDRPTPDGKILGAQAYGYVRRIRLELLADKSSAAPEPLTTLTVTGAPAHGVGYKVSHSGVMWETETEKMFSVDALWIPVLAQA
jgi:hypothetical protein